MRAVLAVLGMVMAGCASPGQPSAAEGPESVPPVADDPPTSFSPQGAPQSWGGQFRVARSGLAVCNGHGDHYGSAVGTALRVDHSANDSRFAADFYWRSASSMTDDLQFEIRPGFRQDSEVLRSWTATSPHTFVLERPDLDTLPDTFWVHVLVPECGGTAPATVHAMFPPVIQQDVEYALRWNDAG